MKNVNGRIQEVREYWSLTMCLEIKRRGKSKKNKGGARVNSDHQPITVWIEGEEKKE